MRFIYIAFISMAVVAVCQANNHRIHKSDITGKSKTRNKLGNGHGAALGLGNIWKTLSKVLPKLKARLQKHAKTMNRPKVNLTSNVVSKGNGYELRCYDTWKWISYYSGEVKLNKRKAAGKQNKRRRPRKETFHRNYLRIVGSMMKKFIKYNKGHNANNVAMKVTVPILQQFVRRPRGKLSIKLLFPILNEHQGAVPVPKDPLLSITELKMCVYAHRFETPLIVTKPQQYLHHVKMLKTALARDGLAGTYEDGLFYTANYDSWFKKNRRKEVWLQKKEM